MNITKNLLEEVIPPLIDRVTCTHTIITQDQNSDTLSLCQIPTIYLRLILEILSLVVRKEPGYTMQNFASVITVTLTEHMRVSGTVAHIGLA